MGIGTHGDQTASQGIHIIHAWEVADAAARLALTVAAVDTGKVALQLSDNTFWILTDHAGPTWVELANASDPDAIHDNVAGEIAAVALKAAPVSADVLLIEDSAAADAKKRVTVGSVVGMAGGQTDTVVGSSGITNVGTNVDADLAPTYGSAASTVCEGDDARLSDARTPTGSAGGDLAGTYPNPTVDDGADGTAIHDNVAGEIVAVAAKAVPTTSDLLLIEDAAAANAKKRITIGTLPGLGGQTDTVVGSSGITNVGTNVDADLAPTYGSAASTICEGDDARLSDARAPTGSAGGDLGGTYPNPTVDDGADGTAIHDDTAGEIAAVAVKVTPIAADVLLIEDSAAANAKKRITVGSLPGSGITGPGSSVDLGVVVWDGTGGTAVADSGLRNYGASATDPISMTAPADGDMYYNTAISMAMVYDGTRAKWLSVDADSGLWFGRNGNTGGGSYYRGPGNRAYSATQGRRAEYDGTVVSISYTRIDVDAATFEVTASGASLATLASVAISGSDVTLDADFSAGDILGVRNQAASNTTRHVHGFVRVRWRA